MENGEPSGETLKVAASATPPADSSNRAACSRSGRAGLTDAPAAAAGGVAAAGGEVAAAMLVDARRDDDLLDVGDEPIFLAPAPATKTTAPLGREVCVSTL